MQGSHQIQERRSWSTPSPRPDHSCHRSMLPSCLFHSTIDMTQTSDRWPVLCRCGWWALAVEVGGRHVGKRGLEVRHADDLG